MYLAKSNLLFLASCSRLGGQIVEQGHGQILEWVENTHEENPTLDEMMPTIWPPKRDQEARNRRLDFAKYIENQIDVDETTLSQTAGINTIGNSKPLAP